MFNSNGETIGDYSLDLMIGLSSWMVYVGLNANFMKSEKLSEIF